METEISKISKFAISSLVVGLLFILLGSSGVLSLIGDKSSVGKILDEFFYLLPALAILLGLIAFVDISRNNRKGILMAIIGILIGVLWFLLMIFLSKVGTV